MSEKYLKVGASGMTEQEATATSAGGADAGKIPALNGSGKIDLTMLPDGVGPDARTFVCSGAIAAGDVVNIFDDAGTAKVRKADASNGRLGRAYVKNGYTDGQTATVYFDGTNDAVSGLTAGLDYFLSGTTPGAITSTAPTTAGHVVQRVGFALSATELSFEASTQPITRA